MRSPPLSRWGSSPLARGTPSPRACPSRLAGLIPARAGNTSSLSWAFSLPRAHPRSRGEHFHVVLVVSHSPGSSPLARGTLLGYGVGLGGYGLIPARAGNTIGENCGEPFDGAHPRSRGEHLTLTLRLALCLGSSPLARGTLKNGRWNRGAFGLIPARAGNTCLRPERQWARWAHPRSRGEHSVALSSAGSLRGSSPLARGTLTSHLAGVAIPGLIPARAGNTWAVPRICRVHGAHPRSRGEHTDDDDVMKSNPGSSPLARGTLAAAVILR